MKFFPKNLFLYFSIEIAGKYSFHFFFWRFIRKGMEKNFEQNRSLEVQSTVENKESQFRS